MVKSKLASGQVVSVCNTDFPTPDIVEFVGGAGFDMVFIDCEHSSTDFGQVEALARAARAAGIGSVVRPWSNEGGLINRYLSCGVGGVQVPHIHDVASVRTIIKSMQEWEGNYEEKLLVAMMESRDALANLPELLKVKEIDVFYLGALDLAQSMGHRGNRKHPGVQAAVEDAIKRIADAGRPAGMNVQDDLEATNRYLGMGLRWVNVHLKVFMQRGIRSFLQGMSRKAVAQGARTP